MNRHQRRAAAARKRRPGYLHRIMAAHRSGAMPTAAGVHHVIVEHDDWCGIYRGGGCNCEPNISISSPDAVTVIDENGVGTRRPRS